MPGVSEARSAADAEPEPQRAVVPLLEPADGIPPVLTSLEQVADAARRLAAGTGAIAVDAERASGYRYGQRAYLVQLRRRGAGTVLIDPVPLGDLRALRDPLDHVEWVLHAASQDLPCLAELGLRPATLFDTELAGRLLGYPRVGLAAMTEDVLARSLEKGHSAADWSTRPLPESWLRYAALDVELLGELRDALHDELEREGKGEWARQEFAALADAGPPAPRAEPWRRTSGLHRVRGTRQLAVVRELWLARDAVARRRDLSPGRVLPDAAVIDAALAMPDSAQALRARPAFSGRGARRYVRTWWAAVHRAQQLAEQELPGSQPVADGPPPARSWGERNPPAAARLATLRAAVAALADEHHLPTENLLAPDTVRRLAWDPPDADVDAVGSSLARSGARPWQIELTARPVAKALHRLARGASPVS